MSEERPTERVILDRDGRPILAPVEGQTERGVQRAREDQNYVPVIIKRTDVARVHPDDILERAIREGMEQLKRAPISLFLSALAGGLILGFAAMSVAVVAAAVPSTVDPLIQRIATALVYPLGFIVCIMSGSQLFTEHTATAVYPVLDRKMPLRLLLVCWAIVILGNLSGTFLSSILISYTDPVIGASAGYFEVARHLINFEPGRLVVSALLAGWLMAQGAWLMLGSSSRSSQILSIYIVTLLIGIGGLHHSIAGSAELFTAMLLSSEFTIFDASKVIGFSLCGNILGGSLFVACLNYAHIRKTQAS